MSGETIGEVPEIPEVPKRPRKTLIAILLIVIVGVAAVSVFIWWYTQKGEEEFNTYSKYGFSFEYPKGMSISENATSGSGRVLGQLFGDIDEAVVVKWLTIVQAPSLEFTLNDEMEHLETGGYDVDRGQLVTSTKAGHEMIYQYFTATAEGETAYGIFGVWYCDTNDKLYSLALFYSEPNTLPRFQQYLDSFVCH